jgi:threonyl-tRNA synthetase
MLVIGEKEFEANTVAVRQRGQGDQGSMSVDKFAEFVQDLVNKELAIND